MITSTTATDATVTAPAVHATNDPVAMARIVRRRAARSSFEERAETLKAEAQAKRDRRAAKAHRSSYVQALAGEQGEADRARAARSQGRSWGFGGDEPEQGQEAAPAPAPKPHPNVIARNVLASRQKLRRSTTRRKSGAR